MKKLHVLYLICMLIVSLYSMQEELYTVSSQNDIPFCLSGIRKYFTGHLDDAQRKSDHVFHAIPFYEYVKDQSGKTDWKPSDKEKHVSDYVYLFKRKSTKPKKWLYLTTHDIFSKFLIEDEPIGAFILNIERLEELRKVHRFLLVCEVFQEQHKNYVAAQSTTSYYPPKNIKQRRRHSMNELLLSKLKIK